MGLANPFSFSQRRGSKHCSAARGEDALVAGRMAGAGLEKWLMHSLVQFGGVSRAVQSPLRSLVDFELWNALVNQIICLGSQSAFL